MKDLITRKLDAVIRAFREDIGTLCIASGGEAKHYRFPTSINIGHIVAPLFFRYDDDLFPSIMGFDPEFKDRINFGILSGSTSPAPVMICEDILVPHSGTVILKNVFASDSMKTDRLCFFTKEVRLNYPTVGRLEAVGLIPSLDITEDVQMKLDADFRVKYRGEPPLRKDEQMEVAFLLNIRRDPKFDKQMEANRITHRFEELYHV